MVDRTQDELLLHLQELDKELLSLLSHYAERRSKASSIRGAITGLLGTVAGLAITTSYFFPDASELLVALSSVAVGVVVAALTYFSQQRADDQIIQLLLKQRSNLSAVSSDQLREKNELIARFLKAEGL